MKKIGYVLVAGMLAAASCKKSEIGFLSDNVFYRSNPFIAEQGAVTYSAPLETDGSTAPMNVTLLDLRDKATGRSVMDSFLRERTVTTFLGEITASDTSLAMINAKLTQSEVRPFNINPTGGRIEMSSATRYLPAGTYQMDLQIQNVKGSRTLKNICDIVVREPATSYNMTYSAWTTSTMGAEVFTTPAAAPDFRINWNSTGESKIVLKWVDKNGVPFNPKNNEVIKRGDRPTFANWSPYYAEVKTDSTIEYRFPETGLPYPLLNSITVAGVGWTDGICYYRVAGTVTDIKQNINTVSTIKFLRSGTYVVTYHLSNVVRTL